MLRRNTNYPSHRVFQLKPDRCSWKKSCSFLRWLRPRFGFGGRRPQAAALQPCGLLEGLGDAPPTSGGSKLEAGDTEAGSFPGTLDHSRSIARTATHAYHLRTYATKRDLHRRLLLPSYHRLRRLPHVVGLWIAMSCQECPLAISELPSASKA